MPDEFSLVSEVSRDGVPGIVVAITSWKHDDPDFHSRKFQCNKPVRGHTTGVFEKNGACGGLGRRRGGLFAGPGGALFGRRLAVALLQVGKNDRGDELLLAVVVELDHNLFVVAGKYGTKPELAMLDLGIIRESGLAAQGSLQL